MGCGVTKIKNVYARNGAMVDTEFICIYEGEEFDQLDIFHNFENNQESYGEKSNQVYNECRENLEAVKNKIEYKINSNKITFKVKEFIPNFKFIYFQTNNLKTIQLINFDKNFVH